MEVPKCINKNEAKRVCINKKCLIANPFICDLCDKKNSCKINHK